MQSQIITEFIKEVGKERFNQGDILKDVSIIFQSDYDSATGEAILSAINLKYSIVINQDCDLEHDYKNKETITPYDDKYLPNIFLLPAYLEEDFKTGLHRGENIQGQIWSSSNLWKPIIQNNNSRFHFIPANEEFQIPNLVIDFKHFYTVNRNFLYKKKDELYLASIGEIFRESISVRYSHFLSRIGLPNRDT